MIMDEQQLRFEVYREARIRLTGRHDAKEIPPEYYPKHENIVHEAIKIYRFIMDDTISDFTRKPIEDIEFSKRVLHALSEAGIKFVYELIGSTARQILDIKGMGYHGLNEIKKVLSDEGLYLRRNR